MSDLVIAEALGRWYGQVVGLSELTLAIPTGVIGLVGPNGAGKSTFLKLVAGEIRPSRGAVRVLGHKPFANREYFRRVGFCPQQEALYDELTGLEMVAFLMRLHGFGASEARRRANDALDRVGIDEARKRKTAGYSKGMRQRVKIAQAIAHSPELVIADEPLNGLDPVGRAEMQRLFGELARGGVNLLVSSHVLHEVESLTTSIVLFHRGRLLAQGAVGDIRRLLARHPRRVEIRARDPRKLARALVALPHVVSVELGLDEERVAIQTRDVERLLDELGELIPRERAGVRTIESHDANLEAVFDYLVG